MAAARAESIPESLLDFLKTEENDILDFANLEWVLDEAVEAASTDTLSSAAPAPIQPAIMLQTSGSGNGFHDVKSMQAQPGLNVPWHSSDQPLNGTELIQPLNPGFMNAAITPGLAISPTLENQGQTSSTDTYGALAAAFANNQAHHMITARNSFSKASGGSNEHLSNGNNHASVTDGEVEAHPPSKKKRTRNEQQMLQNRVAQQKYRERKKAEHEALQNALDQLTAQLAAMKAMEAQASILTSQNAALQSTVNAQAQRLSELTVQVEAQAQELAAAKEASATAQQLVASQQLMILDQHNKLRLQEEVLDSLKGRLRDKMEGAFEGHDPKTVCQRMIKAVRTALATAKNVEGLQEVLENLPEDVITAICKSILCEVKDMWPELAARMQQLKLLNNCPCPPSCAAQVARAAAQ